MPRRAAGLAPVKINMVVKRGVNDARRSCRWRATSAAPATSCASSSTWTSARPTAGAWTTWCRRPRSSSASAQSCRSSPSTPNYAGEVAERWRYRDGAGEIGVIASVTQAFCRDCTRARLSTDGKLYTCLFAQPRPRPAARCCAAARPTTSSRDEIARGLARARRPLLRDPHRGDGAATQGRDVVHRWLSVKARSSPTPRGRPRSRSRRSTSAARWCRPPIAGEHPLTLYVDKREIVTLMTLGARARGARDRLPAQPAAGRLASTTSPRCRSTGRPTRSRSRRARPRRTSTRRLEKRTVTTGCGQGTVFGDLMEEIDQIQLRDDVHARATRPLRPARPRAQARDDLQAGRRGARLRARHHGAARSSSSSRTSAATTRSTRSPA